MVFDIEVGSRCTNRLAERKVKRSVSTASEPFDRTRVSDPPPALGCLTQLQIALLELDVDDQMCARAGDLISRLIGVRALPDKGTASISAVVAMRLTRPSVPPRVCTRIKYLFIHWMD